MRRALRRSYVCTTLGELPGQKVAEEFPTVFGLATVYRDLSGPQNVANAIHGGAQGLAQEAQAALAEQAAALGCNAVLNCHFNYGESSKGQAGQWKTFIVDCYGTPVKLAPSSAPVAVH